MKIKQQVIPFEKALRIYELWFKEDSLFVYWKDWMYLNTEPKMWFNSFGNLIKQWKWFKNQKERVYIPAYTSWELLDILLDCKQICYFNKKSSQILFKNKSENKQYDEWKLVILLANCVIELLEKNIIVAKY